MSGLRIALIVSISLSIGGAALAQATYAEPPPVVKSEKSKAEDKNAAPKAKQRRKCRRDTTNAADGLLGRMVCEGDKPKDGPDIDAARDFLTDRQVPGQR